MRTLFEDIIVQMQEDVAVKKLKADLELQIQGFKNRCIEEGNQLIESYMDNVIMVRIDEKFEEMKGENKDFADGIIQIGTLSDAVLKDIYNLIKFLISDLEKQLKTNDNSVVKTN